MKHAILRIPTVSSRPAWLLALGLLGLPVAAPAAAAGPATTVGEALDLEEVLGSARAAAQREAWSVLEDGLLLTGTTDVGGVDARFELFLTADGRYRFEMDGPLARTLTFDGRDVAQRVRSGPTAVLELGDRENWLLSQWVHSGFWLDPSCPMEIRLVEDTVDTVSLRLSFPDSPLPALLVLDRATWLPRELHREAIGEDSVVRFQQYEPIAGLPIARHLVSVALGEESELRVLEARPAPADPGARYEPDRAPPDDVHFDPEHAPGVELKRVQSGHLLVHPRVDGRDVGWFILDTGAGQVCIDPKVADELELERFGSVPAVGVAGSVQASFRQGGSLELGPLRIDDPVYVEIDLAFLAPVFGVEVAGICGYDVFARSVVELDLEETTLALHDPATYELAGGAWSRLILDSLVPCIPGRFEGDREGLFKVDLGDSGTISFYSPAVESLNLLEGREVREANVGGVGGMGKVSTGDLAWFEIAGHRVEPLPAVFSHTEVGAFSSSFALGNLGTHMLEPFVVVFDYTHSRIALLPRD